MSLFSHLNGVKRNPFTASPLLGANCTQDSELLIDLVDVEVHSVSESQHQPPEAPDLWGLAATHPPPPGHSAPSADEELLSLGNVNLLSVALTVALHSEIPEFCLCAGFDQPIPAARKSTHVDPSLHTPSSRVFIRITMIWIYVNDNFSNCYCRYDV